MQGADNTFHMTFSTLLLISISSLVAFSSTYETISSPPPKQPFHSQTEPIEVMTSHPHARGPKTLSNKNQKVATHLPNEPEILGPLQHSKGAFKLGGDKKTRSLNPIQLAAQSKEFATYLHFEGEEGKEGKDIEDKEVKKDKKCLSKSEPTHWPSPTFDSKSAKRAIESFAKLLGKAKREIAGITVLEEEQVEETPTRFWLRKYYRRLG